MLDIKIYLNISKIKLLQYYSGSAKYVIALATDGRKVKLPLSVLRDFVKHDGIEGMFLIKYTDDGKFISINECN